MWFSMRKGNIQLMENVFTVFILIFIGMIVLIFFAVNQIMEQSLRAEAEIEMEALRTARSLISLPEIQCSIGDSVIPYCIDELKAQSFSELLEDDINYRAIYFPVLGRSKITLYIYEYTNKEFDEVTESLYSGYDSSNSIQAFSIPILVRGSDEFTRMGYLRVTIPR